MSANLPANLENSAVATELEKVSFIPIPKKSNDKEYSNYRTIALISHIKVMLKFSKPGFCNTSFVYNSLTGIPSPPLALFVVMLPKAHLTSHSRMSSELNSPIPVHLSLLIPRMSMFTLVIPHNVH